VETQPPAALATAIANASREYGVPPDVLTGIWRVESGSSYPNQYVNSSGYGGLFGTTNWDGTPQTQANLAASILANLINQHGGNLGAALHDYSGGGYSSVPGQTTGQVNPASVNVAGLGGGGSPGVIRSRPTGGGGGVLSTIGDSLDDVWTSAVNAISGPLQIVTAALWLLKPSSWLRMVEFLVGLGLIVLSLIGLAITLLSRNPIARAAAAGAAVAPGPIGALGKAVTVTGSAGRRRELARSAGARVERPAQRRARHERLGEQEERQRQARAADSEARERGRRRVRGADSERAFRLEHPDYDVIPF
jgi:hypothetical protein